MLLLDAGLKKVDAGLTSLEEVLNTCMAESEEEEQQDTKPEEALNVEMADPAFEMKISDKPDEMTKNLEVK